MAKRGRPTKFTPELGDQIIAFLGAGGYIETAAAAVGISKDTLYRWLKAGARAPSGPRRAFSDGIQKALADAELRASATILVHGKKEWTALAWYLERRYPERWGRRRLELSGLDGAPIATEHAVTVYLPDNQRGENGD